MTCHSVTVGTQYFPTLSFIENVQNNKNFQSRNIKYFIFVIFEKYLQEKKNSLFSVSQEMVEATTPDVAPKSPATTSDYSSTSSNSPNSDLYLEEDIKLQEDKEQVEENNNVHHEEGNIDSDSLDDEGLGDISSEGENAESPLPSESSGPSGPTLCLGEIVNTSCEPPAGAKTSTKSEELSSKLYQDTEKERRPSRIS